MQKKEIEYHGMIWIFDKFVETSTLTPAEAKSKLNQLIASNFIFYNNQTIFYIFKFLEIALTFKHLDFFLTQCLAQ